MKILNLLQGSDEWLAARANHNTASEASAMMGCGYKSRTELLRIKATGDEEVFDAATLARFERGHEVEALARPIAEGIIGDELFPVTALADDGVLLASFDGVTMCESVIWECKSWNKSKVGALAAGEVPLVDYWQVVQQLLVSGADKCLYMVTDGTPEKTVYLWVTLDAEDAVVLQSSWAQFSADLAAYVPLQGMVEAVGRAPDTLPALRVEVSGMVNASNLEAFRDHALGVFAGINTELSTDAQFADAEKTVKWCKSVEDKLDACKAQALEQTSSIDELFRAIDSIKAEARAKRLELDKLVKTRKESVRGEILSAGRAGLAACVKELDAGFFAAGVVHPGVACDFAGVMKNKRTIASLTDAVDTELARAKVEAGSVAAKMHSNLALFKAEAVGYESLFADLDHLVLKAPEDLVAVVKTRIAGFQAEQQAAVDAQAKADAETPEVPYQMPEPAPAPETVSRVIPPTRMATPASPSAQPPSYNEMIAVLGLHYAVSNKQVHIWLTGIFASEAS